MDARDHAAGLPDDAIGSDCSEAGAVLGGTALTAMERSYLSSMGPFEYDDPGPSGIYQKTEADKGHHEDNEFPHLGLVAQARRLMPVK